MTTTFILDIIRLKTNKRRVKYHSDDYSADKIKPKEERVMASKWLKDKQELFNQFKEEKKKEAEQNNPGGPRRQDIV